MPNARMQLAAHFSHQRDVPLLCSLSTPHAADMPDEGIHCMQRSQLQRTIMSVS